MKNNGCASAIIEDADQNIFIQLMHKIRAGTNLLLLLLTSFLAVRGYFMPH